MNFDEKLQLKALELKQRLHGADGHLVDAVLASAPEESTKALVRQVCFQLSVPLFAELEEVLGLLQMSKREFMNGAVLDALAKARCVLDQVKPFPEEA